MRSDVPGFHVHLCLYSVNAIPPFPDLFTRSETVFDAEIGSLASNKGAPRSLYEIARKVDRPLDARLTPLTILWLDKDVERANDRTQQASMSPDAMRKGRRGRDSPRQRQQPSSPALSAPASPTSSKVISSTATSTPVARFVKESSFRIDEGDDEPVRKGNQTKSGSLEVSFGIVHLFRDDASLNDSANSKTKTTLEDDSGTILAVLGVPSYIGPADFLQLIEPAADAISQVRMIREEMAGRCMVLLKFRDAANAEEFHKMYANQPFDPVEDPEELCRVVYVTKVTVSTTSSLPYAYPLLANSDPWPIIHSDQASSSLQPNAALQRMANLSELPTCPVCLERMDSSVTGLMTVTCQHTFHCSCLSRWSDSRCPVCRYTQSRMTKKGHVLPSFVPEHGRCAVCGTGSDLWVCLICAAVGCGRYKAGHAHRHYKETGHLYSLELETQRVWDYAGDGYVHRLIQSKAEFGSADEGGPTPKAYREGSSAKVNNSMEASSSGIGRAGTQTGADLEDKMEALGLEYSHLLSTQLESQRAFYEDQVRVYQDKVREAEASRERTASALEDSQDERNSVRQRFEALTSRYENMHANLDTSLKRVKKLDEDLRGERLLSQGLVSRIDKLFSDNEARQAEMAALRAENADLKEQVRDLMFFVEARAKVANEGGEELRGGDLEVAPDKSKDTSEATSAPKHKKKKKVAKKPPMSAKGGEALASTSQSETASKEDESLEKHDEQNDTKPNEPDSA